VSPQNKFIYKNCSNQDIYIAGCPDGATVAVFKDNGTGSFTQDDLISIGHAADQWEGSHRTKFLYKELPFNNKGVYIDDVDIPYNTTQRIVVRVRKAGYEPFEVSGLICSGVPLTMQVIMRRDYIYTGA
jgi:hypothetical protein